MSNHYGQSGQDMFVYTLTNQKKNGYFLEIGSNHPINHNNTYILEKKYDWKGIMVEIDGNFLNSYKQHRPNSIHVINNATQVNYYNLLKTNQFPTNIDYLQIDLDVNNKSTLDTLIALDKHVFNEYKFACITFEHDVYTGNYFNTKEIAKKIFKERGYVCLFDNVETYWMNGFKEYEDWYVYPDLVDNKIYNTIITNVKRLPKKDVDIIKMFKEILK